MWLENPLQIKLSSGIKRDKNSRTDSRDIALYARSVMRGWLLSVHSQALQ